MTNTTKLNITLRFPPSAEVLDIFDVVCMLPDYSASTFESVGENVWRGDFTISCAVAPELAEGDFIDDFSPYFAHLLELREKYDAEFEFQIAVGYPAADKFRLKSHSVALLAALSAGINVITNRSGEQGGGGNALPLVSDP